MTSKGGSIEPLEPPSYAPVMSLIVTTVFKATIGLLVNKGRDKVTEWLKGGDVTEQKFCSVIVREVDDIKSCKVGWIIKERFVSKYQLL